MFSVSHGIRTTRPSGPFWNAWAAYHGQPFAPGCRW